MRFNAVSEEDAAGCLQPGEYDAVVKTAVEKTSQKGNPMIAVALTVFGPEGKEVEVKDWLLSTEGGQRKLQAFCKSGDIWDTYQAGELCADSLADLNVCVALKIEDSDDYGPQNRVARYVPRKAPGTPVEPPKAAERPKTPARKMSQPAAPKPPAPTDADIPF